MKCRHFFSLMSILAALAACSTSDKQNNRLDAIDQRVKMLEQRPAATAAQASAASTHGTSGVDVMINNLPTTRPHGTPANGVAAPAAPAENTWVKLGTNPYTGTVPDGLKLLGYASDVQQALNDAVKGGRGRPVLMPDGVLYGKMLYSVGDNHKVWRNVRQKLGYDLRGMLYTVEVAGKKYNFFIPPKDWQSVDQEGNKKNGCDNGADLSEAEAAKAKPMS